MRLDSFKGTVVAVAFHVPVDESVARAEVRIRGVVSRLFGDRFTQENTVSNEIVYFFPVPILLNEQSISEFMLLIRELLESTADLTPHFTQNGEVAA